MRMFPPIGLISVVSALDAVFLHPMPTVAFDILTVISGRVTLAVSTVSDAVSRESMPPAMAENRSEVPRRKSALLMYMSVESDNAVMRNWRRARAPVIYAR